MTSRGERNAHRLPHAISRRRVPLRCAQQRARHDVVGYFPSWKCVRTHPSLRPDRIPFGRLTVLNYAFFFPLPDGTIRGRDSAGDALVLRTGGPGTSLTAIAHRHGVRVLLSIGGWEDSGNFPAVAADSLLATRFAAACAGAIGNSDSTASTSTGNSPDSRSTTGHPERRRELRTSAQDAPPHA